MKKAVILLILFSTAVFAQQKGSLTDSRDKKKYKTVKIGEQTWMAENLNYSEKSYTDKDSRCYDNKPANCTKYGRLYNWETAMEACPKGWHLPTKEEWDSLAAFAGGEEAAEGKLKAKSGWDKIGENTGNGTDDYGFAALPSGRGNPYDGAFAYIGNGGRWWSTSYYRRMNSSTQNIPWRSSDRFYLFSVRCLQGEAGETAKAEITAIHAEKAARVEAAAKAKADSIARVKAEAEAKAEADKKAKADSIARVKAEAEAKAKADSTAKAKAEADKKAAAAKPAQQPATQQEYCNTTFPKKACVSVPKGSCKLMGGKVAAKCP